MKMVCEQGGSFLLSVTHVSDNAVQLRGSSPVSCTLV